MNNLHSNYVNFKILFQYLAKHNIPTVITLHDCWFYTGKCMHYTKINCDKWKTGCNNCPIFKKGNPSWFFDRTKTLWNDKRNIYLNHNNLAFYLNLVSVF